MVQCRLCKENFKVITSTHLDVVHSLSIAEYKKRFGQEGVGFALTVAQLSHDDSRYKRWKKSLAKRPVWNRGKNKENDERMRKISETFKKRRIDNFAVWRQEARKRGLIPAGYAPFKKDHKLAELIGVILGDGNIHKFPRAECLTIAANSNNVGFVARYSALVQEIFNKTPHVRKVKDSDCTRIRIYQQYISKRLGVPTGNRAAFQFQTPKWIWNNERFLICFLRGLYEAEGSFCVHKPTSTYKLLFSNKNMYLQSAVLQGVRKLGFHPHASGYMVQLSRKEEVYRCIEKIGFRRYS